MCFMLSNHNQILHREKSSLCRSKCQESWKYVQQFQRSKGGDWSARSNCTGHQLIQQPLLLNELNNWIFYSIIVIKYKDQYYATSQHWLVAKCGLLQVQQTSWHSVCDCVRHTYTGLHKQLNRLWTNLGVDLCGSKGSTPSPTGSDAEQH